MKLTPDGNDEVQPLKPLDRVGVGEPVAVTVKVPALPTVKVVELTLVMAGAWFTVRVKVWVAVAAVLVACRQTV